MTSLHDVLRTSPGRRDALPSRCATRYRVVTGLSNQKAAKIELIVHSIGRWSRLMLDLNDYFYFVQVVDRGGFTAAGRALSIPKSMLTHRLQALQKTLGLTVVS